MTPSSWYPLLRRLHAAGWEHMKYTVFGIDEHVWYRNRLAVNEQSITANETCDGFRVECRMNGRGMSVYGFAPADLALFAEQLGVFEPAPARVDRAVRAVA